MAPTKKTNPFDPQAMLEAQRRNFDAFRNAGQIVADGMRTYAERQVAMMQQAMSGLWSELHSSAQAPAKAAAPQEQLERMRSAFANVVEQVQELSGLLLRVQSEAIAVLNDCATKNLESLGGLAPEFAELQKKAKEAVEAASRQTTAVVDEMKKRMASLEAETRQAAPRPAPPPPAAPAAAPAPAAEAAADEAASDEAQAAPARRPRRTKTAKSPEE